MMVTAIVPTYHEEQSIGRCLTSLLSQRGVDDFEILVVDGRSRDQTVDVVRSFPEFGTRIHLIDNPRRYQVFAWNLGCRAARGRYIAFISAHATYSPDHFRASIDALERTGGDAVGPVQIAVGSGAFGEAVAWCMSSPFGVGNARFRFARDEEEVESVFSMFLRRETFERLGGYDERIAFDEDGEFNYRLRAAGGRIFVSPKIQVHYHVRDSLRGLARQMCCYGYWRRFTRALHPAGVPLRVYAPPLLLLALVLSALLAVTPLRMLALVVPVLYACYVGAATLTAMQRIGLRSGAYVALALPTMHLSYGWGFWRALFTPQRRILFGGVSHSPAQ
jgi:succinoglycan biosynthesis protein ExoA